ncbi:MAG: GspMb/PilO family protein [Pseudomonadota bacterium]
MTGMAEHQWRTTIAWAVFAGLVFGLSTAGLAISQHLRAEQQSALKLLAEKTQQTLSLVDAAPKISALTLQADQALSTSGIFVDAPNPQQGFAIIQSHVDQIVTDRGGSLVRIAPEATDATQNGSIALSIEYLAEATSALEILAELEHGRPMLFPNSVTMNAVRLPGNGSGTPAVDLRISAEFKAFLKEGTP